MISIIAAIGENNELGKDNGLVWHLKGDLKHFKDISMNHKVVMGLTTYYSLPKRLEGREYIVLAKPYIDIQDAKVFDDFEELLKYIQSLNEEVLIIGGASVYKLFIDYADKLYLTEIHATENADVYFPTFNKNDFEKTIDETKEENNIVYDYVTYTRKRLKDK